jgi:hypothetical protein
MEHKLLNDPEFDFETFRANVSAWKANGASRTNIEWNTGPGPTVFYYPDETRSLGVVWKAPVSATRYSELYADFLDYKLAPRLAELAQGNGLAPKIRCVDQQPVQVMRQRRREIEQAQHAVGAH